MSPWVSSGRARAALRRGEQVRLRQAEQRSWVCSWKRVLSVVKPQEREDGQAARGVCVCVCVMVRIWGTEDKGLRTDRVLGGGSSIGHPESQRGHVGKRKEWLCLLFGFRGAVGGLHSPHVCQSGQ